MIQATTPNFGVPATRGWCLKYVDDAGNAPVRRPTAKAAFYAERDAGRISGAIDSPLSVWVIGFLDFTKGPYTVEGHVFFMKNLGGGRYEIRDSEVGTGARKPYGSLAELVAWFGAYAPKFIGWSTDCDGRNYVKEVNMKPQDTTVDQELAIKLLELWGRQGQDVRDPNAIASIVGKPVWKAIDTLVYSEEGGIKRNAIASFDIVKQERDALKSQLDSSKPGVADEKLKIIRESFATITEALK